LGESQAGRAMGTVGFKSDPDVSGCGQLSKLHVLPERFGSGLGSMLYEAALGAIRNGGYRIAGLWVLEANTRARDFYERRERSLVQGQTLQLHGPGSLEVRYELRVERLADPTVNCCRYDAEL
jgi:ribosomal protein S18 acetylase RimI-like enzyme